MAPEQGLSTALCPADHLARLKSLVVDSVTSRHSKRSYSRAVEDFVVWYMSAPRAPLSKAAVQEYRATLDTAGLSASSINVRLAAIRKLATEAADNGLLPPDVAAAISRVKGARQSGVRSGNWLTRDQVRTLLAAPDTDTINGIRDRALLALLIGCGLRRSEVVYLTMEQIQQRESRWAIVDLIGKGGRVRTVPVPAWIKALIDEWSAAAPVHTGRVFRSVNKAATVWGDGLTEKVVWWIVQKYAQAAGVPKLAPHDLRRTCAKLCRANGGDLEQIQLLLGHASIQTTERYLGSRLNLTEAVNDRLGIEPSHL
jgi:site-specific recombinase XerD